MDLCCQNRSDVFEISTTTLSAIASHVCDTSCGKHVVHQEATEESEIWASSFVNFGSSGNYFDSKVFSFGLRFHADGPCRAMLCSAHPTLTRVRLSHRKSGIHSSSMDYYRRTFRHSMNRSAGHMHNTNPGRMTWLRTRS